MNWRTHLKAVVWLWDHLPLFLAAALVAAFATQSWYTALLVAGFSASLYQAGRLHVRVQVKEEQQRLLDQYKEQKSFLLDSFPRRFEPIELSGFMDPLILDKLNIHRGRDKSDLVFVVVRQHVGFVDAMHMVEFLIGAVYQWHPGLGMWKLVWPTMPGAYGGTGKRKPVEEPEEGELALEPAMVRA